MAAEIATLEKVKAAVSILRMRGIAPTADRVIDAIGGGSKSTVLSHLKTLRNPGPEDEPELPPHLLDVARSALAEIYRAGAQAEADRSRTMSQRLSLVMSEQESQIDEFAAENARLGIQCEGLSSALKDARFEAEALLVRLKGCEQEVLEVRNELATERSANALRLDEGMQRLEALITMRAEPDADRSKTRAGAESNNQST